MKSQTATTQIRVPVDLHEDLKKSAADAGISMNAEIIRRLTGGVDETVLQEVAALRQIGREQMERHQELEELLNKRLAINEKLAALNDEYKAALLGIVKDLIKYFEDANRSPESERAMLIELVKLLSNLKD